MITTNGTYLWSFVTEIFRFWWHKLNHSELQYKTGICKSLLPKDCMDTWTRVRTINKGKWDELMKKSYFLCKQKARKKVIPCHEPLWLHILFALLVYLYIGQFQLLMGGRWTKNCQKLSPFKTIFTFHLFVYLFSVYIYQ